MVILAPEEERWDPLDSLPPEKEALRGEEAITKRATRRFDTREKSETAVAVAQAK